MKLNTSPFRKYLASKKQISPGLCSTQSQKQLRKTLMKDKALFGPRTMFSNRVTDPESNQRGIFQIGLVGLNSTSDLAVEEPRFQLSGGVSNSNAGDVISMDTIDEINAISSMASDSERRPRQAPTGMRSPA
jgi:hypothetical protein